MNFTEKGTLAEWKDGEIYIIPQLYTNEDGKNHGGAFLCIPNFEELSPPFTIKHGEYRTINKETPHHSHTTLASPNENTWGSLDVTVNWQEESHDDKKNLIVTVEIHTLTNNTIIRPGFHPYFAIQKNSLITIGETCIALTNLPHNVLHMYRESPDHSGAHLTTSNHNIALACTTSAPLSISYGIWSDDNNEYVCIEPVVGHDYSENNMPTPIRLQKDETIILTFTITATRLA
jgi:galactose mutarotase-like enzyme